jgi:DNA-directed RNA polymerase specialized sigma24 family protein
LQRAAFRDVHGRRLHGFALLLSLGDRPAAARAAGEALTLGARQSEELQHPERAAAWLRARAFQSLKHAARVGDTKDVRERRDALRELGAADAVFDGLAAIPPRERAVLIATSIERFDPIDVETIVGLPSGSGRRLAARTRERYLAAVRAPAPQGRLGTLPGGELAARVAAAAERAMGSPEARAE